eukprot:15463734-Alexandrium_andersonii.AAC.1
MPPWCAVQETPGEPVIGEDPAVVALGIPELDRLAWGGRVAHRRRFCRPRRSTRRSWRNCRRR